MQALVKEEGQLHLVWDWLHSACVDTPSLLGNPACTSERGGLQLFPGAGERQLILCPGNVSPPAPYACPSSLVCDPESDKVKTSEALLHECIQDIAEWVYW